MVALSEGMLLYHGSYANVESIDLARCSTGKDFGRGFYLTSDETQARKFIRPSLRKAQAQGHAPADQRFGFVTVFEFHRAEKPLKEYGFDDANGEWLRLVAYNRRQSLSEQLQNLIDPALHTADIIMGKVANDATNPTITTYLTGVFGPVDDDDTIDLVIARLLPNKLTDQYCFRTQLAIGCLTRLESTRYDV